MRVMVLVEAQFLAPDEKYSVLLDETVAWRERYKGYMESFEVFAGTTSAGFVVIDAPDEALVDRIMFEFPFAEYSEITVRPILDGDRALEQWRELMAAAVSAEPGAE